MEPNGQQPLGILGSRAAGRGAARVEQQLALLSKSEDSFVRRSDITRIEKALERSSAENRKYAERSSAEVSKHLEHQSLQTNKMVEMASQSYKTTESLLRELAAQRKESQEDIIKRQHREDNLHDAMARMCTAAAATLEQANSKLAPAQASPGFGTGAQKNNITCDCCNKAVAAAKSTSDNHVICANCERELKDFHDTGRTASLTKRCFRCKIAHQLETWHECLRNGDARKMTPRTVKEKPYTSEGHKLWLYHSVAPRNEDDVEEAKAAGINVNGEANLTSRKRKRSSAQPSP